MITMSISVMGSQDDGLGPRPKNGLGHDRGLVDLFLANLVLVLKVFRCRLITF